MVAPEQEDTSDAKKPLLTTPPSIQNDKPEETKSKVIDETSLKQQKQFFIVMVGCAAIGIVIAIIVIASGKAPQVTLPF
ncbi:hypothetical protein COW36_03520 [bacterium (Candidatus Blackallbacteria) CG17_big_fil_post_rev_8_21_14_2_50_48_46]|uniref:Uncharacterized protein n=1 Tax=bacterium (Candidatus Blackallbacteria) CG17_big_fil_post_rev_8_21_14_2_50_48_46 TaxID=2014261 RepID=A0A2M7G9Q3_9BACT|nr:MAG: hypothetical protein COW64_25940 [bacterium (Candidatus Blackallbacteria) CG18_big_fil_WC_8_21_14_2_50_49_26]PIW18780.1 MAG: hypothetical protein COW36_03520 [bacterium (Candidatus Blackallbacteria) CG17_big_fil_post_rev_8_21_14_2_50_48_46]